MVFNYPHIGSLRHLQRFMPAEKRRETLEQLCEKIPGLTQFQTIGMSESGRPIDAVTIGVGKKRISLLSGSHSDEPVGSETIMQLVRVLIENHLKNPDFLRKYTFVLIPHANPDGEQRNRPWIDKWPDVGAYLQYAFRELPGRDVEFGYPDLRIENEVVAKFLEKHAPFDLHASLHGMGFSEGAMLLIERSWLDRTKELQQYFLAMIIQHDLPLHDHDRNGEKGFVYIGPGFTTTPESQAMRTFFKQQNNPEMAAKFKLNSMELVKSFGGDPFCMVTELPLFIIGARLPAHKPGYPAAYLKFREQKGEFLKKIAIGDSIEKALNVFQIRPLPLETAVNIQLNTIFHALKILD